MKAVDLHVVGDGITEGRAADVRDRLHRYDATTRCEGDALEIRARVAGHEGPASAIGDVQQSALFEVARAGIRAARVDVVHARRSSAIAARRI